MKIQFLTDPKRVRALGPGSRMPPEGNVHSTLFVFSSVPLVKIFWKFYGEKYIISKKKDEQFRKEDLGFPPTLAFYHNGFGKVTLLPKLNTCAHGILNESLWLPCCDHLRS